MKMYNIPEIAKGVFAVGSKDWNRRMFDALIPLPHGTSYNAYLVKGSEKTALVDTVNHGFENELLDKIKIITQGESLDYVVMNHAEPDHAGSISCILNENNGAVLITTEKGKKMAQTYFNVPEERIKTVKDGDCIELGEKTLKFIDAPFLHWPETMFTYLVEDKVLLSCDFFGAHTAFGIYDDDVEEIISLAKSYFGEIMMPFKKMGNKALDKIKNLEIDVIAPSHGPIYKNTERILSVYRKWTVGDTREKAIVLYVSMWNHTEKMIKTIVETLQSENIEVCMYNIPYADLGDVAKDLVDSRAVVLGTPNVLGGAHPVAIYIAHLARLLKPPLKYGVVLSSYGWNEGAVRQIGDILEPLKIEIVGTLEVNGPPSVDDDQKIISLGKVLAGKIKG